MPRKKRPVKIITLDTETIGLDGALKRIAIYDGLEVTYGYTFDDILPAIMGIYKDGFMPHIYIHNADFDLRKMPQIFERGNIVWSRTRKIGTKYAKIQCKYYTIHDSFKILPKALAKLSKDFDLAHGKLDLWEEVQKVYPGQYKDHVDFLNRCDRDDPLYLEYLGYDVISLFELIEKLMDVSGLDAEKFVTIISTASLSKFLFKNGWKDMRFQTGEKSDYEMLSMCKAWSSKKTMKHSTISYLECEYKMREGFYGGRTEVFTPNCEARNNVYGTPEIVAYHYDVNSLYPSVMIDNYFPIGYPEYENDPRLIKHNWERWMEYGDGLGFLKAVVYVPPQTIPPLPCKLGKLAFVTGYIQGTWAYPELKYAIENCGVQIVQFIEQIHFTRTYKVFHNFITCFYEMKVQGKRDGNASLTEFAKLIQNTSYGWTVLRRDDKTAFRDIKDLEKWREDERFIYADEELGCLEIFDNVISDSIQVQIGAYVTAYARLTLLDALRKQAEKGTVYYCDTDSIICSAKLPPEMVDPYALGKWDLEGELYSGLFLQPKVYTEHKVKSETIKFKGVSKSRQKQLDRSFYNDLYRRLCDGEKGKLLVETGRETLPSLAVAQKRHENPNVLKVMDKSINLEAKHKRNIDFKGNVSQAWHMESLEMFQHFNFETFHNAPTDPNIFGG